MGRLRRAVGLRPKACIRIFNKDLMSALVPLDGTIAYSLELLTYPLSEFKKKILSLQREIRSPGMQ
jgi:hypothetical protein